MQHNNVSRTELANRLGITKGCVSQLLDGQVNMTLQTVSDLIHALGYSICFDARRAQSDQLLKI